MRHLEWSSSYRQKVEWWVPGAGSRGLLKGHRVPVFPEEKSSGDWLPNNVNVLNISKLYTHKWYDDKILCYVHFTTIKTQTWTSLVAQWLRIRLPMQGTLVRSLVREYPTCCGATKPVHHNYWAYALEPASHNYWACVPQLLKPMRLEPMLCSKKLPQWEARAPQRGVAPARRN